jgi:hypothetical protein
MHAAAGAGAAAGEVEDRAVEAQLQIVGRERRDAAIDGLGLCELVGEGELASEAEQELGSLREASDGVAVGGDPRVALGLTLGVQLEGPPVQRGWIVGEERLHGALQLRRFVGARAGDEDEVEVVVDDVARKALVGRGGLLGGFGLLLGERGGGRRAPRGGGAGRLGGVAAGRAG